MKISTDPELRDALARRLAASQKRIVVFGQAQQNDRPPRQKSVRAEFVEALEAIAKRRARQAPVETAEAQAQRARRVEAFAAKLKHYRQFA